jgi:hypothetical protein
MGYARSVKFVSVDQMNARTPPDTNKCTNTRPSWVYPHFGPKSSYSQRLAFHVRRCFSACRQLRKVEMGSVPDNYQCPWGRRAAHSSQEPPRAAQSSQEQRWHHTDEANVAHVVTIDVQAPFEAQGRGFEHCKWPGVGTIPSTIDASQLDTSREPHFICKSDMRIANDGNAYTPAEFLNWYGHRLAFYKWSVAAELPEHYTVPPPIPAIRDNEPLPVRHFHDGVPWIDSSPSLFVMPPGLNLEDIARVFQAMPPVIRLANIRLRLEARSNEQQPGELESVSSSSSSSSSGSDMPALVMPHAEIMQEPFDTHTLSAESDAYELCMDP